MEPRALGASGIFVGPMGVGTNRWGARDVDGSDVTAAYRAARSRGLDFIDTAEMYNGGESEKVVGELTRRDDVVVASKLAPFPHRVTRGQFDRALDATLRRLDRDAIDLYYLHFPYSFVGVARWMDWMADAAAKKKIRAVGISNCGARHMRVAAKALASRGLRLAANQVHYHLRHRHPETNGVLDACRELDVALVAYRPLGGGAVATAEQARVLADIARAHESTSHAVALHFLLRRDPRVIVIPGSTKALHVNQNAQPLDLTADELAKIGETFPCP